LTPTEEVLRILAATYSHIEKLEQMLERLEDNQFFMVSKISYAKTLTSQYSRKEKKRNGLPCRCDAANLKQRIKLFLSSDTHNWSKEDILHKLNEIVFPEKESFIESSDSKSNSVREEAESSQSKKLQPPKINVQSSEKLITVKSKGEKFQSSESLRRLTDSHSKKSSKFIQFKKPGDYVPEEGVGRGEKVNETVNPIQNSLKFILSLASDIFVRKEKTHRPLSSLKQLEETEAQLPRRASHKFILKKHPNHQVNQNSKNQLDSEFELGVSKKDTNATNQAHGNSGYELKDKFFKKVASKLFIQQPPKGKPNPEPGRKP
jgi:hypothetical protein